MTNDSFKNQNRNNSPFFSDTWWSTILDDWNSGSQRAQLANLGTLKFECQESDLPPILINWDEKGVGTLVTEKTVATIGTFKATWENWQAFIRGDFTAIQGVVSGNISYEGSVLKILPYSEYFDLLVGTSYSHL
jgi:putative sterol carrier protein